MSIGRKSTSGAQGGFWGHVLVSATACLLTVSTVGSAMFLIWRVLDRRQVRERVVAFVASLENRTPKELAERAADLKAHPKVAKYVMPEIVRAVRGAKSENRQRAAIEISRAFLDNPALVDMLVELRVDPRESIAAAAVEILSDVQPVERAVELMGKCLADAHAAAARDEACAALYALGEPGMAEMGQRLSSLSTGRRLWLVAYVESRPGPMRMDWLRMLAQDSESEVRSGAESALQRMHPSGAESRPADEESVASS